MLKALKKFLQKKPNYVPHPPVRDIVSKTSALGKRALKTMEKETSRKAKPTRLKKGAKKAKKKVVKAKPKSLLRQPGKIGAVVHFYADIKVAVVKFSKPPKLGEEVRFKGSTTDFKQKIASAQYDHVPLKVIPKGKQVGLKVKSRVRIHDGVFAA